MGALATASELARAIREREASVLEIVDAHLARIAREDPALNAIVTLDEERALGSFSIIQSGLENMHQQLQRGKYYPTRT